MRSRHVALILAVVLTGACSGGGFSGGNAKAPEVPKPSTAAAGNAGGSAGSSNKDKDKTAKGDKGDTDAGDGGATAGGGKTGTSKPGKDGGSGAAANAGASNGGSGADVSDLDTNVVVPGSEGTNVNANTNISVGAGDGAGADDGPDVNINGNASVNANINGSADATAELSPEQDAIGKCLANWGDSPFTKDSKFRKIAAVVSVLGFGGKGIVDTQQTNEPELVLIGAAVSVLSKTQFELKNENGWYCMMVDVGVKSSTEVELGCKSHLADSAVQVNVGSSANGSAGAVGVHVLSDVSVTRPGC